MDDPNDIFVRIQRITGHAIPVEERTDAVRKTLEALQALASSQFLTGLPNKKALDELLEKELTRIKHAANEEQTEQRDQPAIKEAPSTFVAIDLDGFKAINDTYGHGVGDEALKHFAGVLKSSLRPSDIAIHMSGDEFGAVIRADENAAQRAMNRIRSAMMHNPFTHEGVPIPLSFSFGCHEITPADQHIKAIKDDADDKAIVDKGGKAKRLADTANMASGLRQGISSTGHAAAVSDRRASGGGHSPAA